MGVLSLFFAAQAGAVVTVSPTGNVTATSGVTFLAVRGSSGPATTLQCATSRATGTLQSNTNPATPTAAVPQFIAPVIAPASPVDSTQGNLLLAFAVCRVAGVALTVACDGRANIGATGRTVGTVTPGRLTGISCKISVIGCLANSVTVTGGVDVSFDNPSHQLTIPPAVQTLAVVSSCSIIPTGTGSFSAGSTPAVYTTTAPLAITAGP